MKIGIGIKIIVVTSLLIACMAIFLSWYFVRHELSEINEGFTRLGQSFSDNLAGDSGLGILAADYKALARISEAVHKREHDIVHVQILDEKGTILVEVGTPGTDPVRYFESKVSADFAGLSDEELDGALWKDKAKEITGTVRLGLSMGPVLKKTRRLEKIATSVVLFIIIIAGIVTSIAVKWLIERPLKPLMEGIAKISSGDLSYQVKKISSDEIGDLAAAFNLMANELKSTHVSRQHLDDILSSMFNSLVVTDANGYIVMINSAACDLFRYRQEEVQGHYLGTIFAGQPKSIDLKRSIFAEERVCLAKDMSYIPVIFSMTKMQDSEGKVSNYVCVFQDITDRKWAEEQMERFTAELERSNRDLEQFAYIASHDLQEPLRMVAGYVGLIERRYKAQLDSDAQEFITYAVGGVNRMQSLIEALLTYSRVGRQGTYTDMFDVAAILGKALSNLEVVIHETETKITHGVLTKIRGDEVQLLQLFQNLIANSIKFRPKGRIPQIHIDLKEEANEWVLSFKDNGIGINLKHKEHLFKIFSRLHTQGEYPGTGIGLAVCKKIVNNHGGKIWFESEEGKGTTFLFTIAKHHS